jgi:Sodium:neurotransmitter symporter family
MKICRSRSCIHSLPRGNCNDVWVCVLVDHIFPYADNARYLTLIILCGIEIDYENYFKGLDSTFGGLEAMITALCDEYPRFLGLHREKFVAGLLVLIYICSLPTCTYVSRSFILKKPLQMHDLVVIERFMCGFQSFEFYGLCLKPREIFVSTKAVWLKKINIQVIFYAISIAY